MSADCGKFTGLPGRSETAPRLTNARKMTEPALDVSESDAVPSTALLASESTEPESDEKKSPAPHTAFTPRRAVSPQVQLSLWSQVADFGHLPRGYRHSAGRSALAPSMRSEVT